MPLHVALDRNKEWLIYAWKILIRVQSGLGLDRCLI